MQLPAWMLDREGKRSGTERTERSDNMRKDAVLWLRAM